MRRLRLANLALGLVLALSLSHCATGPGVASTDAPFRRVAWLEGDLQNGYEGDRRIAEAKLEGYENGAPDPNNTGEYLHYLSVLDTSGKATEASEKMRKYLSAHPQEKRAVFLLAVHFQRNQKKEIASYLFSQLEKDAAFPWKSLLYNNLGMIQAQEGNRPAALGYFEKATQALPPTAAPLVNLGAMYLQSGSYIEAEKLFAKAREMDPDFEDAAQGLGVSLEGQGKYEESHQVYSTFMESNPNALSVVYNDAIKLGNYLKHRDEAAQQMLRYIQRGGKETAKAHEIIQTWR